MTEDLILKVADFGLARKVYDSIYRPSGVSRRGTRGLIKLLEPLHVAEDNIMLISDRAVFLSNGCH